MPEKKVFHPLGAPGEYFSLGYKEPKYYDKPEPNYTPPNEPSFVDIFKGKDDNDVLFKTYLMTKYSAMVTAGASIVDICVGTQPKDMHGALKRIGYWGIPLIGGGLAYTSVVCTAASLRKKTDQWNHAWGGVASGLVFGAARKNIMFGVCTGAFATLIGVIYKESVLFDYELFPPRKNPKKGFSLSHKFDMTYHREMPGNWVTDPTPQPRPPLPPACK